MISKTTKLLPGFAGAFAAVAVCSFASTAKAEESSAVPAATVAATVAPATEVAVSNSNSEKPLAASAETGTGTVLKNLLDGTRFPLTIKFGRLSPEFRRFVLPPQNDSFATYIQLRGAAAGVELGVYYTKGETVELNGDTYLAAYRADTDFDLRLLSAEGSDVPAILAKPAASTNLTLSLLNLRTTGSFTDIRPFDAKLDGLSPEQNRDATLRVLSLLNDALQAYLQDHKGILPQLGVEVTPALNQALHGYARENNVLQNPATDTPFVPNANVSGQNLKNLSNAKYLPVFSEATASGDGRRAVLFLDGHIERIGDVRWKQLQAVKPATLLSPVAVLAKVKAALNSSGSNFDGVSLDCGPGVLVLKGAVDSPSDERLIDRIARQQAAGYKIINQLKVDPLPEKASAY